MFLKILLALAIIVALFLAVAAFQPAAFRIARSTTISAPSAAVFARVNDLHQWQEFSPWAKLDPAMQSTYAGPAAGVGAAYSWTGNSKVGEGRMTIVGSRPAESIRIKLEFLRPFAATNDCEFTFKEDGGQTVVTWSMSGQNNFAAKAAGLVMNMDKLVGGDFEKGLANLKALSEHAVK